MFAQKSISRVSSSPLPSQSVHIWHMKCFPIDSQFSVQCSPTPNSDSAVITKAANHWSPDHILRSFIHSPLIHRHNRAMHSKSQMIFGIHISIEHSKGLSAESTGILPLMGIPSPFSTPIHLCRTGGPFGAQEKPIHNVLLFSSVNRIWSINVSSEDSFIHPLHTTASIDSFLFITRHYFDWNESTVYGLSDVSHWEIWWMIAKTNLNNRREAPIWI